MTKRYDVCSPRTKKDGGTYWVKIGTAWEGDKGTQVVFDALPIADKEGRVAVNLFEPREKSAAVARPAPGYPGSDLDDDTPF